eukprot:scaffold5647_cov61-Cylindrotheca_fusiformis.AAC.1
MPMRAIKTRVHLAMAHAFYCVQVVEPFERKPSTIDSYPCHTGSGQTPGAIQRRLEEDLRPMQCVLPLTSTQQSYVALSTVLLIVDMDSLD